MISPFGSPIHECAFGGALMLPGLILVSNFIWSCFNLRFEYGKPGTYSLNICQNLRSNGWLRSGIIPLISSNCTNSYRHIDNPRWYPSGKTKDR